jgi:hypothetical protein
MVLAAFLLVVSGKLIAQAPPATGFPVFGSFSKTASFDTVNLANLNVAFSIPVVSKAGRGIPFSFNLGYNSSVWQPLFLSGSYWFPATGWGWAGAGSAPSLGSFTYQWSQGTCIDPGNHTEYYNIYGPFTYTSPDGTQIQFNNTQIDNEPTTDCTTGDPHPSPATGWSSDGSDWSITASLSAGGASAVFNSPSGWQYIPSNGANPSITDTNGNQITMGTQNGSPAVIDTLGLPALWYSGSAPVQYSYTNPSGGTSTVTVNYSIRAAINNCE